MRDYFHPDTDQSMYTWISSCKIIYIHANGEVPQNQCLKHDKVMGSIGECRADKTKRCRVDVLNPFWIYE